MRWDRGGSMRWARGSQTWRRRTIRWSAGRRRGGRGEACSPFRARLSAHFRRPRLAGGGEDGKRFRSSQRLPPSSFGRLLPLLLTPPVAISYAQQLYIPPLLSAQAASALAPLLPFPPKPGLTRHVRPRPIPFLCIPPVPHTHTDTGVGRPLFGQLSLDCLTAGARLPYQVLHIRPSAQPTCTSYPNTIGLCLR